MKHRKSKGTCMVLALVQIAANRQRLAEDLSGRTAEPSK